MKILFAHYKNTLGYIFLIVLLNTLFSYVPMLAIWHSEVSPIDITIGIVYVLRDFAQRETGHYVIVAMMVGGLLSYLLADKAIATASIASFLVAESVDWVVYTFTKKPLSQRILWSSLLSTPIDSFVFLYIANMLNMIGLILISVTKMLGVFAVWAMWRKQARQKIQLASASVPLT